MCSSRRARAAARGRGRGSGGLRLELARRAWIRLGRDVVGQRTEVMVARNRFGPPGRRADLGSSTRTAASATPASADELLLERRPPGDRLHADPPPTDRSHGPTRCDCSTSSGPTSRSGSPREARWSLVARLRLVAGGPVVLGGQPWTDGIVLDASPARAGLGVRRGMPLGSAHRLAPEATFLDPEPDADRDAGRGRCDGSPRSAPASPARAIAADPAFGRLEVQVDGLDRLWGPEVVLAGVPSMTLAGVLPGRPRSGIAGTRFAATRQRPRAVPPRPLVVPPGRRRLVPRTATGPAPDARPDIRARLTRFGLRRIGQVAELPRSALVARFGDEGARLHARAGARR